MRARGGHRGGARKRATRAGLIAVGSLACSAGVAEAAGPVPSMQVAATAVIVGLGLFAALCGATLLVWRRRADRQRQGAEDALRRLTGRLARFEAFDQPDAQVVLAWNGVSEVPDAAEGRLPAEAGAPADPLQVVAFRTWLAEEGAAALAARVALLRERGESFDVVLRTRNGLPLEAEGRCAGSSALLRLRLRAVQPFEAAGASPAGDDGALRALVAEATHPSWVRDQAGALAWVNASYARSVGARDPDDAVARRLEFLDPVARQEADGTLAEGRDWRRRITVAAAGQRRSFDVVATPTPHGSAGMATDVSEAEAGRREIERLAAGHQRTLDSVPTPVALFAADRRLVYCNAAWRELWGLDPDFLAERPDEAVILDRLREARRLPEQANYREWKAGHLEAYRSAEARESWWHLPDGRTVRTHMLPNPQGGLTLVQEDVTEVLDLKARHLTAQRMQRETLDALSDAVAVFGQDGRLKLSNPAFAAMWRMNRERLGEGPHIDAVVNDLAVLHGDGAAWAALKRAVVAFEYREAERGRLERRDGDVIDFATVPLPDGATLVTFTNVTAPVNVERALQDKADALKERNQALVAADRLKNDFVQHVSYELRSPLTNIIGFAQLLSDPAIGPLNDKQHEYMRYIMSSSSALLAIINDILDLATIDAGVMTLELGEVDVAETMLTAAEAVRDRCAEEGVALEVDAPPGLGRFTGDPKRVRQVLYNLLSNAVGFSMAGMAVRVGAERQADGAVAFVVSDQGRGMDPELLDRAFRRFESRHMGTKHRGAGLGLSIVKSFVELHGGTVAIASEPNHGTVVRVVFPAVPAAARADAAA